MTWKQQNLSLGKEKEKLMQGLGRLDYVVLAENINN
jgi:hypothetical protein